MMDLQIAAVLSDAVSGYPVAGVSLRQETQETPDKHLVARTPVEQQFIE